MNFISTMQPLEFWARVQQRVVDAFQAGLAQLRQVSGLEYESRMDNVDMILSRVAQARSDALMLISRLENYQSLNFLLATQLDYARQASGLSELQVRIACCKAEADMQLALANQPSRFIVEEDMRAARARLQQLQQSGRGESIAAEKLRLTDFTVRVPVLGREDVQGTVESGKALLNSLSMMEAEAQALRSTYPMAIRIAGVGLAQALAEFGVTMSIEQDTSEAVQVDAPVEPATPQPASGNAAPLGDTLQEDVPQ